MKDNNILKRVSYNFVFGIVGQVVTIIVGIIIPRLFIVSYGSEVNGFINSVNQVFVYVALLEAGVGSASLQALYAPIGREEKERVNAILSATHYFYKRTGIIYVGIVIALAFTYPFVVSSSLDYWLMFTIILINGISGALTYFFQGKYRIFLQAEGKNYVISNLATINQVALSLGKAVLLLLEFDVVVVQSLYLILNGIQCVVMFIYIKRNYVWIDLKRIPDFEAISQKNSVLIHQISSLIFNNTDVLLLTFFCNLKVVSVYVLYKNFLSMISTVLSNVFYSVSYRFGQVFQERNRFIVWHDIYETFHFALTFALFTIAYIHFTPFLRLYTRGMDINYLLKYMPILMICAETLSCLRMPSQSVITYAGHFKQTQWRAVVEMMINFITSVIGVKIWGIYGVVLGTIIALVYRGNDIIVYVNHEILNRKVAKKYRLLAVDMIFSVTIVALYEQLNIQLSTYVAVVFSAIVMCLIIVPMQVGVNYLLNREEGRYLFDVIKCKISKAVKE